MHFESDNIYHVYNRGNNKVRIFFSDINYQFLLNKIRSEWLAYCDIYAYCLMPNHFHFMLEPNKEGCENIILKGKQTHLQLLSKTIGKTLSSYTQAINNQNDTSGNLFQKKTKSKCLTDSKIIQYPYTINDYLTNCIWYIHNNPLKANLVQRLEEWPYSSWHSYYRNAKDALCNIEKARKRIDPDSIFLFNETDQKPDDNMIDLIY